MFRRIIRLPKSCDKKKKKNICVQALFKFGLNLACIVMRSVAENVTEDQREAQDCKRFNIKKKRKGTLCLL